MPYIKKKGVTYGGIPNGAAGSKDPTSVVPTTVKQLTRVGGTQDFAPVTIPSAVKFSNGDTLETMIGSVATIETSPAVATHAIGDFIFYNGQIYEVIAAIAVGETLTVGTNIQATSVGEELSELKSGLTQLGKIYRFDVTSGAVAANGRLSFVKSYAVDDSIYVSGGNAIKFTRSGTVRIDLNVSGQTTNRLWLLIHGNNNHNFIVYGTYVTCTSSIVVQVSPSYEFYIVSKEACTINGGGTDPSEIFFTWMG